MYRQHVILSGEKRLRFSESKFCGLSLGEQAEPRSNATMGSPNGFGWLSFTNVTFTTKSHRDFEPYPCGARAPWFCFVIHSAKLRLRAPHSAQNDIQRYCVIK